MSRIGTARWTDVKGWAPIAVLIALMLALAWVTIAPADDGLPLDPRSTAPSGTAALVAVLGELGAQVVVADTAEDVADGATAARDTQEVLLVLRDPQDEAWSRAFDAAVARGATVVVTDPASALAPAGAETFVAPSPAPECSLAPLSGVNSVTGTGLVGFEVDDDAVGCFPVGDDVAWLVASRPAPGDGVVVATGGPGFLTNASIDEADNALMAGALLVPTAGARVVVVGPEVALTAGAGDASLIDLVPTRVKLALGQLLIALIVVVAWRWRRLGAPVEEDLPVVLQGSDLVVATGQLLGQAGEHGHAGAVLSDALRRDLALRVGLGPGAPARQVALAASSVVSAPADEIEALLDPPASDGGARDAAWLVSHTRRIARLRAAAGLSGDRRPEPTTAAARTDVLAGPSGDRT